jgi:uncharacterized protein YaaQ
MKQVTRLLTAVVQEQDAEPASLALQALGVHVFRLPSVGGFLRRRSVTLLVGIHSSQQEAVMAALAKSCRRRVEYVATPLEGSPLPFPSPAPVNVGGATIFVLDVERYEEF